MRSFIYTITLLILLASCEKEVGPQHSVDSDVPLSEGVLVLNEGTFQRNNASITFRSKTGEVNQSVYESVNNSQLGDVLNSVYRDYEGYYFVINNSGIIDYVDHLNLKSKIRIEGFRSPRCMQKLNNEKALVSNFVFGTGVENEIDVVDLQNGIIERSITVNGWCEQIVLIDEDVYVANTGENQVLVLDRNSLEIKSTIQTPIQPAEFAIDANGFLWVLCTGGFEENGAALCRIDPVANKISNMFRFSNPSAFPSNLIAGPSGLFLYLIETNIFKMSISATELPADPYIEMEEGSAYSMGIEPESGNVFIGDAKDFTSPGEVYIYSSEGTYIESFTTGVIPGDFIFR